MPATISTHINIFKAPRHPAPRGRLTFAVLGRWWIRLRAFLRRCFGGRPAPDASTPTLPIIEDQEVLLNPDPEVVKGEPGEVPEWAAPLGTARRLERFESAVLDDLRRRPLQAEYRAGVVVPQGPASQASQGWGLANLAQLCAGIPEFRWPAVIAHHFDLIVRVGSQEARLERELKDYANARPQLVPRLWDEQAAGDIQDRAVWRRDIPGLLTVLSIDLPESIRTVNRELLEGWGVGEDQAFARAFDNLDALTDRTINAVELGGGQRLLEIRGPSYYTASLALKMDTLPELSGPHGAFVGLPTRHMLLSLPFSSPQTMEKLHLLLLATRAAEQQGPGALYAVLDAARDEQVLPFLHGAGVHFQSLYEGLRGEELALVAPYLVALPQDAAPLAELVRERWGDAWGIFLRAEHPFRDVRRHLRRLLRVELDDGARVLFRFYDPRVLRAYLPTCTGDEAAQVFGPLAQYVTEGRRGETALRFQRTPDGVHAHTETLTRDPT